MCFQVLHVAYIVTICGTVITLICGAVIAFICGAVIASSILVLLVFVHLVGLDPGLLAPFLSSHASWIRCLGFLESAPFQLGPLLLSSSLAFLGLYLLAFETFRGTFCIVVQFSTVIACNSHSKACFMSV